MGHQASRRRSFSLPLSSFQIVVSRIEAFGIEQMRRLRPQGLVVQAGRMAHAVDSQAP